MNSPIRNAPRTKAARRQRILELIAAGAIRSQVELTELLITEGFLVTQATVSRDLDDLGATKVRNGSGLLAYAISPNPTRVEDPISRVARMAQDLLITAEASGNLVVVRTPPGGAQLLASALDRAISAGVMTELLGTLAGDDTVLMITRATDGGAAAASQILQLAQGLLKSNLYDSGTKVNIQGNQSEGKRS
ncbi:arginine repressor [mine drainage metagenome]|uniref:Arginine repressor n=1 Tax=mine drainage metagenome TaxID=410659 RepID=A0A1J5Q4Q2_9ZZZZ